MQEIKIINDIFDTMIIDSAPSCSCKVDGDGVNIVTDIVVLIIVTP